MITISIDQTNLLATVEEEISRVADRSYSEDGTSLYDAIVKKSKDDAFVSRALKESADAIRSVCGRFLDYFIEDTDGKLYIVLGITDRRSGKQPLYESLIETALVGLIVSKYLNMVQQAEFAKRYDDNASVAVTMLSKELYGKLPPTRPEGGQA